MLRLLRTGLVLAVFFSLALPGPASAAVGDPQVRTDHPWYPGELACSTFERLFATQAEVYRRVTGSEPRTDEQKALASWLWRNTHYFHGEEGAEDLWGKGFTQSGDLRTREYWTGLFAHGFGLCGTTHSQWTAEMEALLGHTRGRGVGVKGHNSFEVFLKGGPYAEGRWALLDHDISTVVFNEQGNRLLSIPEVKANLAQLTDRGFLPKKQCGWLVCGLDARDGGVYADYNTAEYLAGYSGPPPAVHLRRGETLRRYLQPGLGEKTYVFWGRNYGTAGIPGPERSQTWVNQPEKMYGSRDGTGHHPGQARYGNAVYTYRPDFRGDYREGVVEEDEQHVVFEFNTPYIIGATPPDNSPWGIYLPGGRNGLVLRGRARCPVAVSVDRGKTWQECGEFREGLDLTDRVKGTRQYWLRLGAGAKALVDSGLTMTTVCQANPSVLPRLKDGGSRVSFAASGQALVSAGPTVAQAQAHVVEGAFNTPRVTMELRTPRGETPVAIYAAAHVQSGNPPAPETRYQIELSTDGGKTWQPVVRDWLVQRRGDDPADFWSQSLCWGSAKLPSGSGSTVRVRFRNDGGKRYSRCEAHLVYRPKTADATQVTFGWREGGQRKQASHRFAAGAGAAAVPESWDLPTGKQVETEWVEFEPVVVEGSARSLPK